MARTIAIPQHVVSWFARNAAPRLRVTPSATRRDVAHESGTFNAALEESAAGGRQRSADVFLDDLRRPDMRRRRIVTGVARHPTLAQQIPTLVELDLQVLPAPALLLGERAVLEKLLLFCDQALGMGQYSDVLRGVVHATLLGSAKGEYRVYAARSDPLHKLINTGPLCGFEHEIDVHRIERKVDLSDRVPAQHASSKQRAHIAVRGFHVPPGSPCRCAVASRPVPSGDASLSPS